MAQNPGSASIRFVTPQQRHDGLDVAILGARRDVYEAAKRTHPDRWRTRPIRNWKPVGAVWLNPDREASPQQEPAKLAA